MGAVSGQDLDNQLCFRVGVGGFSAASTKRRRKYLKVCDLRVGGGGGSRTRVRKRACERPYRFSLACYFAPIVKAGQNRPRLVRLISPVAPGPRASSQPTFMTLCPTAVGGWPAERVA
jgi:hypothetical protein